ncbi:MAG: hypothetical protein ABR949_10185 [Candidatus Aquilonibacter sp.]
MKDGASKTTTCGTCWGTFTGRTPKEAADLLKQHYAALHPTKKLAEKRKAL